MATSTETSNCPLCGGPSIGRWYDTERQASDVECARCGHFKITDDAVGFKLEQEPGYKPLLSAYCRRLPHGAEPPVITPTSIEPFTKALPHYTPPEKLDNLLELMGRLTPALGEYTTFKPDTHYPLLVARDQNEVHYLLREALKRGYVDGTHDGLSLTLAGWERLEGVKSAGRLSNRVFVAMWFDKSRDDLYEKAIEPAIRDAKYDPLRIDRYEYVNRIDDEIIGQIRRSRFMVADFTGQRLGVYFEAGMMMGLGRTVIWLCDKNELDEGKLHLDVRQFNFIGYESIEDARSRLYHRILSIEGEGPGQFEKP